MKPKAYCGMCAIQHSHLSCPTDPQAHYEAILETIRQDLQANGQERRSLEFRLKDYEGRLQLARSHE